MAVQAVVTLTALGSTDGPLTRDLVLTPESPVISIGRASKTDAKGIKSASNNAWLDSPVVSRAHGEIRLSRTDGRRNGRDETERPSTPLSSARVVLVDVGSSHGTVLNDSKLRLSAGTEYTLTDGTTVTFGTEVTRGAVIFSPPRFSVSISFPFTPLTPESRSPAVLDSKDLKPIFGYGIAEEDLYVRSDLSSDSEDMDYGAGPASELGAAESESDDSDLADDQEDEDQEEDLEDDDISDAFNYIQDDDLFILENAEFSSVAHAPVSSPKPTKTVIVIDEDEPTSGQKDAMTHSVHPLTVANHDHAELDIVSDAVAAKLDQTRSRLTLTDILNSVPTEAQSSQRKRKFTQSSAEDDQPDRCSEHSPVDSDSLPDAQPRELPIDSSISSIAPTASSTSVSSRPMKKAKTASAGGSFVHTATAAMIGVAVGAVGVFAALVASAPADI